MALKHDVAFTIPKKDVSGRHLVHYFSRLGYKLVEENEGVWRFHRGNKLAVLWRFDIRAYSTDLVVRTKAQPTGESWVSCDFEVWTFMSLLFHGDVATLE
ncbi:MAG: hypothetical protein ACREXR_24145, partial [Gammaproteobacteria bacterium]